MIKVILDLDFLNYEMIKERVIIFDKDGELYYINDSFDKVDDVSKMPNYIKDDYYKYQSKVLTLNHFNKLIEKARIKYTIQGHYLGNKLKSELRTFTDDQNETIKTIRRDLSLKEIL